MFGSAAMVWKGFITLTSLEPAHALEPSANAPLPSACEALGHRGGLHRPPDVLHILAVLHIGALTKSTKTPRETRQKTRELGRSDTE